MSVLEGTEPPAAHEPGLGPSSRCHLMPGSDPIEGGGAGGQRSEIQHHRADVQTLLGPRGRRRWVREVMGALSAAPTPGPGGARATRRCSSELLQAELPV